VFAAAWLWASGPAFSHCDTLDEPVVAAARTALERKDITPVLKWIKREHEAELKTAFALTLSVRVQGREARKLADQFFFETLVRVHRAGEGAPYTGLKPAGTKMDPAVAAADRALESGKADALIKTVTDEAATGLRQRFADAIKKKKNAGDNVEAGREFVAAYVELVHYVEALHTTATRQTLADEHDEVAAQPARATQEHNH
jgi:hypothetical protein